jgi:hypothetical protein
MGWVAKCGDGWLSREWVAKQGDGWLSCVARLLAMASVIRGKQRSGPHILVRQKDI